MRQDKQVSVERSTARCDKYRNGSGHNNHLHGDGHVKSYTHEEYGHGLILGLGLGRYTGIHRLGPENTMSSRLPGWNAQVDIIDGSYHEWHLGACHVSHFSPLRGPVIPARSQS